MVNVRIAALKRLKSDIALGPKGAKSGSDKLMWLDRPALSDALDGHDAKTKVACQLSSFRNLISAAFISSGRSC